MLIRVTSVFGFTQSRRRTPTLISVWFGLAALFPAFAKADSVNSPNITMNVDTNRAAATGAGAGDASVTVNTITIAETMLPEYSSGSGKAISIKVKPGFQFDPTSNITAQSQSIGINGGGVNAVATMVPTGAADEVITFNFTSGTNTSVQDIIRINGIRVRIISAAGAAGPAQTTMQLTTSAAGGAFNNQGIVAASIQKGAAHHLAFSIQPGNNTVAGADLLPAVKMVDFGENILTNDARTISLELLNAGGATLNGTTQHDTLNGIATWVDADNLNIAVASAGYMLRASHSGAAFLGSDTVDSTAFAITAGLADHLVITKPPVNTAAGADILIDVQAQDGLNNPVAGANITLDSGINPGGWPLLVSSSLTKTTGADGKASWGDADNLHINTAIQNYLLAASGVGSPLQTNTFNIVPGPPAALRFAQQPTNVAQDVTINPAVTVQVLDEFTNRVDATTAVQLVLGTAPCGGSLTGTTVVNAVNGLATFDTIAVNTACNGNVLTALSLGLVSTDSEPFNVTGAAACGVCGAGATMAMAPMLILQIGMRKKYRRRR